MKYSDFPLFVKGYKRAYTNNIIIKMNTVLGFVSMIKINNEIELDESEISESFTRSSGPGGQHINKTDSAIRITHIPTGVVVQCQNDRSQHRNRASAYDMLRARLYEIELSKREESIQAEHDSKTDIGWGHQIRSYVLQPYQLVKDLRTEIETSDTQSVLDGNLDLFLSAALAAKVGE